MEDFTKTKYWQHLLNNKDEVKGDWNNFNNEFSILWSQSVDELGVVLKSHLVIESYMNRFLIKAYPNILWSEMRLTFIQKLSMCDFETSAIQIYSTGIKELNTIRNRFAHRISYQLKIDDYKTINRMMTMWSKAYGTPPETGLNLFYSFVLAVCVSFSVYIENIDRYGGGFGLSGYLKWLKDMQEPV